MKAALELQAVTAGFGPVTILHGVDLSVSAGGRVALIGRNGVGKTTLLKTVMGLADVHAGEVRLFGEEITRLSARERAHAGLGYVPQTRDIFPSLTVEENLVAGLKGRPRPMSRRRMSCFRASKPAVRTAACSSPAANSRCSPSRARCSGGRACCCWMNRSKAWRPSSAPSS